MEAAANLCAYALRMNKFLSCAGLVVLLTQSGNIASGDPQRPMVGEKPPVVAHDPTGRETLLCRTGSPMSFSFGLYHYSARFPVATNVAGGLTVTFNKSTKPAGATGGGLARGECSFATHGFAAAGVGYLGDPNTRNLEVVVVYE